MVEGLKEGRKRIIKRYAKRRDRDIKAGATVLVDDCSMLDARASWLEAH